MARILITGTSSGIGLATAVAFARAGHSVYATMRNPPRALELAHRAAAENLPITVTAMDVDSDESVQAGIDRIANEAGGLTSSSTMRASSAVARWRSSPWPSSGR
jgi:NAD(P)-dependent dehydrogenase (short-subunit alcohol dehydrogenase family)